MTLPCTSSLTAGKACTLTRHCRQSAPCPAVWCCVPPLCSLFCNQSKPTLQLLWNSFIESVCSCVWVPMCVCMYALRTVSLDKILHFVNTFIIIIYLLTVCHSDLGTAVCITSPRRHSLTVFGGSSWHDRKDSRCQHRLKRSLF